jgi:hypothetical protein
MYKFVTVAGIVASLALVAPTARANIVLNGDFDANSPGIGTAPADWTLINAASGSDFFVGPGPVYGAFSPPNSANFGAVHSFDDTLEQTLSTIAGQSYSLTYELAHADSDAENDFSASWGGVTIPGSQLVNDITEFNYTEYSFIVTAASSSTVLAFAGREVPSWYELDNVVVTPVPEPRYYAVLGVVLVGLPARRYFQRRITG